MNNGAKSGDLTICRYPGGYLVGRLRSRDDDLVWEQEVSVRRLNGALMFAQRRATREGVAIWLEVDGQFERVNSASLSARE